MSSQEYKYDIVDVDDDDVVALDQAKGKKKVGPLEKY